MKIEQIPNLSGLPEEEKKKIVHKLLQETFTNFLDTFTSLGYTQKIWGKWTNSVTNETFEIEFKKIPTAHQFGL
jgi:hypothetical protein